MNWNNLIISLTTLNRSDRCFSAKFNRRTSQGKRHWCHLEFQRVADTPTSSKKQIVIDIISALRNAYHVPNQPPLGRVYQIEALRKDCFDVAEYRDVL
ncbi:hypothetical protein RCL_jg7685.t1 [Rhizophagus clarus]|uniref:Uncharacterized protein n=1 Tax=Rhizophagus clarus TaxID=94130 RepID=A0A8H3MAL4_9GLOM|nr:hypothetical protein RCL_jg7685.t1 [Rhizophagus clarus]